MGGIVAEAIPSITDVTQTLRTLATIRLPFKATAGLHHPLRSTQPLTYRPQSPTGLMHGFVNLSAAAALLYFGGSVEEAAFSARGRRPRLHGELTRIRFIGAIEAGQPINSPQYAGSFSWALVAAPSMNQSTIEGPWDGCEELGRERKQADAISRWRICPTACFVVDRTPHRCRHRRPDTRPAGMRAARTSCSTSA